MKKFLGLGLVSMSVLMANVSQAQTYVGVGLGYVKLHENATTSLWEDPNREEYKNTLSGHDLQGSLILGKRFDGPSFQWFVQAGGMLDKLEVKKTFSSPGGNISNAGSEATQTLSRVGTLNLDVGVQKNFGQFDASLRLGLLLSKFQDKIESHMTNSFFKDSRTQYTWGIAPGVAISRSVGNVDLGLDFSYQMYQEVKTKSHFDADNVTYGFRTKPRYLSFMATLRKSF